MNWDTIQGNWKQLTGKVKEEWGDLTDNEVTETEGQYEKMSGLLQTKYGIAKEEAETKLRKWADALREEPAPR